MLWVSTYVCVCVCVCVCVETKKKNYQYFPVDDSLSSTLVYLYTIYNN